MFDANHSLETYLYTKQYRQPHYLHQALLGLFESAHSKTKYFQTNEIFGIAENLKTIILIFKTTQNVLLILHTTVEIMYN